MRAVSAGVLVCRGSREQLPTELCFGGWRRVGGVVLVRGWFFAGRGELLLSLVCGRDVRAEQQLPPVPQFVFLQQRCGC